MKSYLLLLSLVLTAVELYGKVVFPVGTPDQGLFEGDIKLTEKQEKIVKAAIKRGGQFLFYFFYFLRAEKSLYHKKQFVGSLSEVVSL